MPSDWQGRCAISDSRDATVFTLAQLQGEVMNGRYDWFYLWNAGSPSFLLSKTVVVRWPLLFCLVDYLKNSSHPEFLVVALFEFASDEWLYNIVLQHRHKIWRHIGCVLFMYVLRNIYIPARRLLITVRPSTAWASAIFLAMKRHRPLKARAARDHNGETFKASVASRKGLWVSLNESLSATSSNTFRF